MPRAANRLSPLPIDEEQLVAYLRLVREANLADIFSLEEIVTRGRAEITNHSGKNYQKSTLTQVIRNLIRLGLIVEENSEFRPNVLCTKFLEGSFVPRSNAEAGKQISLFGHLFLECMLDLGMGNLDPYIVDQIAYFFGVIRKHGPDSSWTNNKLIESTSDEADPVRGFLHGQLTKEGRSRVAQEYLKMLGFIGVIEKEGSSWSISVDSDAQDFVRTKLRDIRFEKFLQDVIGNLGSEHRLLGDNHRFFRATGRYITYRYSGGIDAQRGLRDQVMKSLDRIRADLVKEYEKRRNLTRGGKRPSLLRLISILKEIHRKSLMSNLADFDDQDTLGSALGAMSLHELEVVIEQNLEPEHLAEDLRSRGSSRYNRLILKRLQHQDGQFNLPDALVPHRWQTECIGKWEGGDGHNSRLPYTGIASAVTGSGKTVMALMATSRFVKSHPGAVVSVVVPSKVLMYQWAEETSKFLGLGPDEIGFVGDGFSDSFSEGRRVIIWIVNSAVKEKRMQKELRSVDESTPHLLIADECHEYGGDKFRTFLEARAEGRLAISATPPDQTSEGDRHPVLKTMGAIFYRLGYRQAHAEDLISGFKIRYLGIQLEPQERAQHTRLSDVIRRLGRDIEEMYGPQLGGGNIIPKLQSIMKSGDGNATIAHYLKAVRERKDIVREASHRDTATVAILNHMREKGNDDFTMLWFHEQIDETQRLASEGQGREVGTKIGRLNKKEKESGELSRAEQEERELLVIRRDRLNALSEWFRNNAFVRPGMYHSKFPHPWGHWMVNWFRNGYLNVMLSARALAQGFDMPGADVGIIRSSTSNVRQRIQTIGRMIRKEDRGNEAEVWILFVKNTSDERIFMKHDWEDELPDVEDVQTYWELSDFDPNQEDWYLTVRPERKGGVRELPQPDRVLTTEELLEIAVDGLECGDQYPDRRAIKSTSSVVRVDHEGLMTIIDGGAEFEFDYELLEDASEWVLKNRGRGQIHVLENGHAVARSQTGRIVFLANLDLEIFDDAVRDAVEEGDDFQNFMKGF